ATTDAAGVWMVRLEPVTAVPEQQATELTVTDGARTVTFADVLVGEVWVGSGQSNMATTVKSYASSTGDTVLLEAMNAAPYPAMRLMTSGKNGWQMATPGTIRGFSALLFAFGVRVHSEMKVPMGLICGSVSGTPSGPWVSPEALAADVPYQAALKPKLDDWNAHLEANQKLLKQWEEDVKAAQAQNKPAPKRPQEPGTSTINAKIGELYAKFIHPLVPYGIRGVLWDQGESGTCVAGVDQLTLMGALIRGWRAEWAQGEFPFIYIQKPSGGGCSWDPASPIGKWASPFKLWPDGTVGTPVKDWQLRDSAYLDLMKFPNAGMAIASDLGAALHPPNKSGYGHRAADVALAMVYGKPIEYYGPVYASHTVDGAKVTVHYQHIGKGLASKPADHLQGFLLSGDGKTYYWANAVIDGETVVVTCPKVEKPIAIVYLGGRPFSNLFNQDGLPALPFMATQPVK
ncbi:MAG: hypothetical protein WCJ56_09005, partial [bacterium]